MRGEPRGPSGGSRRAAGVLLCVLLSAAAAAAPAQTLRGYTQVQFQRFDVVDDRSDRDLWLRTLQLDGTRRFGQNLDVSGQIYWNEVSTRGRPDRIRSPRGTLRLAHPEAGVWLSYRPVRSTDAVGLTTESNELQASGYFARPKLPAINATWTRRTQQSPLFPTPPSVTRNVTAAQTIGPASLRLGWFDQVRDAITKSLPGDKRQNAMAGGEVRFGPRRASFLAQYDVNETKRIVGGTVTERSLLHTASLNGTSRISPKTDAALTYGFRRTLTRNGVRTDLDDHEGNATFNFRPRPSLRFGSGGGV
ncbi:MAG TPA: hypothetical protein VE326_04220, partial [Candidatus Binatia bacterium]|nr:hypothetical protein [Candidatus Binatia bacterium]